jgi:hypothetical protein
MSAVLPRKKSPRAPSLALDDALDRALKAYEKERLHAAPTEVVAQNLGYKTANSGTALGALASLRYFGLLDRPKDGLLSVTKDVEAYKFSPDEALKRSLLIGFVQKPPLFAELLAQYVSGLPSDANIRYELIKRGFSPQPAEATVSIFRRSVEFSGFFSTSKDSSSNDLSSDDSISADLSEKYIYAPTLQQPMDQPTPPARTRTYGGLSSEIEDNGEGDRIPVRLPGGRRAWLIIPTPFFKADKVRIKAQIDLLLTQDEDDLG